MHQGRIWISWEKQRRSIELSHILNCQLKIILLEGFLRYPISSFKTISFIIKKKPDVLFVQNPSMFLATIACIYCSLVKLPLVVDRHTTFLIDKPIINNKFKRTLFLLLHHYTLRIATLTIVTNNLLADLVIKSKGRPFILPDPLPSFKCNNFIKSTPEVFKILVPISFAPDEPLDNIIAAANILSNDTFYLYITGDSKRIPDHLKNLNFSNITFTGFLPDQEYIDLLFSVDGVLVLTTATSTMLCGCYEAVTAEKPLITSNKPCLVEYFTGAVFVDNSPQQIANACKEIKSDTVRYVNISKKMKEDLTHQWAGKLEKLESLLQGLKT